MAICTGRSAARALAAGFAALTLTAGIGAGVAAADAWPQPGPEPSPTDPFETSDFLTAADPAFWNPLVSANRLSSPFGTTHKIVCKGFHGVLLDCWQADNAGNAVHLIRLPVDVPGSLGSLQPGGGPSHFVYPPGPGWF